MKNKKTLIAVIVFVVTVVLLGCLYYFARPDTKAGEKEVTLVVVDKEGEETTYEVTTDGEYLIDVMEAAKESGLTYEGSEGEFGLMIDTINRETTVYAKDGAYWAFFVNGEYCEYGVSKQPAADGDEFEIRYTTE